MTACSLGRGNRPSNPLDAAGSRPSPALVATASERHTGRPAPVRTGPVVIGCDASRASVHALAEAAALLRGRKALIVTVWKQGLGFELIALPASGTGLPPAPIDVTSALEVERTQF